MQVKKILTGIMALGLVSVMSVGSFAQVDKQVTVYKDINKNEMYTGMGTHASEAFSNGITVNNNEELKLEKVKTRKIKVFIFTGYVEKLILDNVERDYDKTTYEFDFSNGNVTPKKTNDGRKYYSGEAKINVMGITHKDKHVDLQINE